MPCQLAAAGFAPFGVTHAAVVIAFVGTLVPLCLIARRLDPAARRRLERAIGIGNLACWGLYVVYWLLPANFSWERALPLHLCDIAALFASLAMIWPARWLATLTYYWGIVLSSQAFVTPTLTDGPGDIYFWMFWYLHAAIVGGAVYELAVRRYRPQPRDGLFAIAFTLGYLVVVLSTNIGLGANYGYVGPDTPAAPTIIDVLGPWPVRVLAIAGLAMAAFGVATLPGVWRAGRVRSGPRSA